MADNPQLTYQLPRRVQVSYNPDGMKDRIRDTMLVFEENMKDGGGSPSLIKLFMPLVNRLINSVSEKDVAEVIRTLRDEIFPYILYGDGNTTTPDTSG